LLLCFQRFLVLNAQLFCEGASVGELFVRDTDFLGNHFDIRGKGCVAGRKFCHVLIEFGFQIVNPLFERRLRAELRVCDTRKCDGEDDQ
jgi:hypothetical protein